jgi:beta-glucanase (GH16 family)
MQKTITACLLILTALTKGGTQGGSPFEGGSSSANTAPEYKLAWSDEFNTPGAPNPANWTFEKGFVRNNEHQWYQPENARCENGLLIIEARHVIRPNPNYDSTSRDWRKNRPAINYTSACLISRGLQSWQYGRFEMRGRIDIGTGLWPAWWTLGVQKRWPGNGEIDIMEYYRGMLLANFVCIGPNNTQHWFSNRHKTDSLGGAAWAAQFHTWRMDWDEQAIALYVDDNLLNKVPMDSLQNQDGSNFHPFKQPHYMLLNLAIGGDNGGKPDSSAFPRRFEVDYVRVYRKE